MDPEFPRYYQKELSYITESFCGDFAQRHVKIAARFGIQAGEITDLYLQRLIQSFAFVAAGSQMGIDRHSHEIPLAFLDGVDINYTAPLPSLGIARFFPDADGAHSAQGLVLARGTPLTLGETAEDQSTEDQAAGGRAECVFHTTQPVAIWPLAITRVKPTGVPADIPCLYDYLHESRDTSKVKGALRLRLATLNGTPVCKLGGLDRLAFHLCGDEAMASRLRADAHRNKSLVIKAWGNLRGVMTGRQLTITDHPFYPVNRKYIVTGTKIEIVNNDSVTQGGEVKREYTCRMKFWGVPSLHAYRIPLKAKKPRAFAETAVVTGCPSLQRSGEHGGMVAALAGAAARASMPVGRGAQVRDARRRRDPR
ncbi:type VI secretion system baseplate subunit TssF [Paraburkholderia sp.]|uniref:type VI secretion system baseplate subunit TssF n=1 Tax=Paraburkholderia sp. TaxID=1926495 RepID=UPI0038620CFD